MLPDLRTKPPCHRDDALAVLTRLRQAGHEAYFAGGCVRDLLMGLEPKDYDVATDAPPQRVRELFTNTQAVGAAFGVILVRHRRSIVEVATFRAEGEYLDGRRPSEVRFTTAETDAQRRDFTINGLFLDPLANDAVIDFVGGQRDLAERKLRAIGNPWERFAEDHLRLLRAVRFAARFGLEIEAQTRAAIITDAPKLKRITPERIADELRLMLTPSTRDAAWRLLWDLGLMAVIFRFLPGDAPDRPAPERSIFLLVAPGAPISFGLALAAGALEVRWAGPGEEIRAALQREPVGQLVRAMRQALRISNDEADEVEGMLEGAGMLLAAEPPPVAVKKRFLARPTAVGSRALLEAFYHVGVHRERIASLRAGLAELEKGEVAPVPLITGDDLAAAGLSPGPIFKRVLDAVYDAQLEDRVGGREEALGLALELAATLPPAPRKSKRP